MNNKKDLVKRKKSMGHLSKAQKESLLDLMRERPHLRSGKFSKDFTLKDGRQEWENISNILNAIPGSQKDWRLWRKTWQDIQSKAKTKMAEFNKAIKKTGGGLPPDPVNEFEEGVVALINKNSVSGHEGVEESMVEFEVLIEEEAVDVPTILPPPELHTQEESIILDNLEPDNPQENQQEKVNKRGKEHGKKINMKTLLKQKLDLKSKLVESTIQFQKQFIKLQEDRNQILKDLLCKYNEKNNNF